VRTVSPALVSGVAVVMPAYREEDTLAETAQDFLSTLRASGCEHCVVIVNDGSPDRTGLVAELLRVQHPGRVRVAHHDVNRGYGAAVGTGIRMALEQTRLRHVFLTDADGQFKADHLPDFVQHARDERADAVIGYRTERTVLRRFRVWLYSKVLGVLLHIHSKDADCAYKLIDRRVLTDFELDGNAEVSQVELLAKLRKSGARIIELPVRHHPRPLGHQPGVRPSTLGRSTRELVHSWQGERRDRRQVRRLRDGDDPVLRLVTLAAVISSVAACLYFGAHHQLLDLPDAIPRLLIARRVVAGSPPGLAQLGGVWLPLPFLLSLVLVWNPALYHSGLAASVVSMAAYVVATRYVYRIGLQLTRSRAAAAVGAGVFALNVNVLYMQATPMSELLLLACVAGATYHLMCWQSSRKYQDLTKTSLAVLLATLTRYEGWVLLIAVALVVVYTSRRRIRSWARLQSDLLFFLVIGASGVAAWLVWNAAIFHDPLYFKYGPFARSELFVLRGDKAIGNWVLSLRAFADAVTGDLGVITVALAGLGACIHIYRSRLHPETLGPLVSVAFVPFFVYGIHSGQLPLHVTRINGDLYNVRFGLVTAVVAAIFIAVVVGAVQQLHTSQVIRVGLAAATLGCALVIPFLGGGLTVAEAHAFRSSKTEVANAAAARWLRTHYDHGRVLMESFRNEIVTFESGIPSEAIVWEGSSNRWERALTHPGANGIRWIYMRSTPGDRDDVWSRLNNSEDLNAYQLVYQDPDRLVYELAGSGAVTS
jgi:hypothetical protein